MSYFVRNLSSDESARFVLSFPKSVLAPIMLPAVPDEKKINEMIFSDCPVDVTIKVGSTDFAVLFVPRQVQAISEPVLPQ